MKNPKHTPDTPAETDTNAMDRAPTLLQALRAVKDKPVSLSRIKTDKAFQPRDTALISLRERAGAEEEAETHIAKIVKRLAELPEYEVDPILIAKVGEVLWLIDGHHRLMAYRRRPDRHHIPAKIVEMSKAEALGVSLLANLDGTKLTMHKEQARDAAFQFVDGLTEQGTKPLPKGMSYRTIAAMFGIDKNTVQAMVKILPKVTRYGANDPASHPGTGLPRWKYVKGCGWSRDPALQPTPDHKAEKGAVAVGKLHSKLGDDVFLSALAKYAADRMAASRDTDDAIAAGLIRVVNHTQETARERHVLSLRNPRLRTSAMSECRQAPGANPPTRSASRRLPLSRLRVTLQRRVKARSPNLGSQFKVAVVGTPPTRAGHVTC